MATYVVSEEERDLVKRKLEEIKRQIEQPSGSPLEPHVTAAALQRIVEGKFPSGWDVWKVITIGGMTGRELLSKLAERKVGIDSVHQDILTGKTFKTSSKPRKIVLTNFSGRELGFTEPGWGVPPVSSCDIVNRAKEWGLESCPREVGPHLLLQWDDMPEGETTRIYDAPDEYAPYHECFELAYNQGENRQLRTWRHGSYSVYSRWIFCIPG